MILPCYSLVTIYPWLSGYFLSYGNALFIAGRYEEAEAAYVTCLHQMPTAPYSLRSQMANYGQLDKLDNAARSIEECRMLGFKNCIMSNASKVDPTTNVRTAGTLLSHSLLPRYVS